MRKSLSYKWPIFQHAFFQMRICSLESLRSFLGSTACHSGGHEWSSQPRSLIANLSTGCCPAQSTHPATTNCGPATTNCGPATLRSLHLRALEVDGGHRSREAGYARSRPSPLGSGAAPPLGSRPLLEVGRHSGAAQEARPWLVPLGTGAVPPLGSWPLLGVGRHAGVAQVAWP